MSFYTLDGQPVQSLSVKQMRTVDYIAMEKTGTSLNEMMERAGISMAQFTCEQWPRGSRVGPVIVLVGPGHNGGGGICAAYHLVSMGVYVCLCLSVPEERLSEAAARQLSRFDEGGGVRIEAGDLSGFKPFLILDALIGYGLNGSPHGVTLDLIEWANTSEAPILSLDMPSGLDADTGLPSDVCIHARQTLTLALPKYGLITGEYVGELWLADIGIGEDIYQRLGLKIYDPFAGTARIRLKTKTGESPILPGNPLH